MGKWIIHACIAQDMWLPNGVWSFPQAVFAVLLAVCTNAQDGWTVQAQPWWIQLLLGSPSGPNPENKCVAVISGARGTYRFHNEEKKKRQSTLW